MIEIRIHGRGGQGAVTAAELLGYAAFKEGRFSQAFPRFGPERSGAPVEAYTRIDSKFIGLRSQIYEPDHLIILDRTLMDNGDVFKGLKKNGTVTINTNTKINTGSKTFDIDATKIAMEILGRPIVNTVMLGAFAKATGLIKLKSIEEAITEKFSGDTADKNTEAIRRAYKECIAC
jgi:pyruvate ferredoxin oxidoreductase gamma subunit